MRERSAHAENREGGRESSRGARALEGSLLSRPRFGPGDLTASARALWDCFMLLLSRETEPHSSMLTEPELPQECNRYVPRAAADAGEGRTRRHFFLCVTER